MRLVQEAMTASNGPDLCTSALNFSSHRQMSAVRLTEGKHALLPASLAHRAELRHKQEQEMRETAGKGASYGMT